MTDSQEPASLRETVAYALGLIGFFAIIFEFVYGIPVGLGLIALALLIYPKSRARAKMSRKPVSQLDNKSKLQPAPRGPEDDMGFMKSLEQNGGSS